MLLDKKTSHMASTHQILEPKTQDCLPDTKKALKRAFLVSGWQAVAHPYPACFYRAPRCGAPAPGPGPRPAMCLNVMRPLLRS